MYLVPNSLFHITLRVFSHNKFFYVISNKGLDGMHFLMQKYLLTFKLMRFKNKFNPLFATKEKSCKIEDNLIILKNR